MKLSVLVTLSLVSLGSLLAGDLQQLADNLQVKAPTADDKKLTMPRVKEATIRLQGAAFAVWNDEIDRLHKGYGAMDIWQRMPHTSGN